MQRLLKLYRLLIIKHETLRMLLAVAFALSVLAAYSTWDYFHEKKSLIGKIDKRLYSAAVSVPFVLEDDFHDRAKTQNSISKAEDEINIENLSKLNNRLGTKFLYTVIRDKNGIYRLSSSSALDKELRDGTQVRYFTAYPDANTLLKQSFQRPSTYFSERNEVYKPFYVPIFKDRWGTYRSIFLPMRTAKGNLYVVGADMDISYVNTLLRQNTLQTILEFFIFSFAIFPIVFTYVVMLKRKQKEYRKMHRLYVNQSKRSITDPLTRLYNRYKLDQELQSVYEKYQQYGETFSLLMMDIDHFKSINDRHGHQTGDEVLQHIAKILQNSLRSIDTIGRWGGEEFIIICPKTDLETGYRLADKLHGVIADSEIGRKYGLTVSFGIGIPYETVTLSELLHQVDTALYQAKRQGRNQTVKANKE